MKRRHPVQLLVLSFGAASMGALFGPQPAAEQFAAARETLRRQHDERRVVGALGVVEQDGELLLAEAVGIRHVQKRWPIERSTVFRLLGMTRPIIAVAALTLHEDGRLDLAAPVSDYLPELKDLRMAGAGGADTTVPATRAVTVLDLLRQTSGLAAAGAPPEALSGIVPGPWKTSARFRSAVARRPLLFEPGTRWSCGVSTDVLGQVIEAITRSRIDVYVRHRILDPLKMTSTGFTADQRTSARLATVCFVARRGQARSCRRLPSLRPTRGYLSAANGMFSSARDLLRFLRMLRRGGEFDGVRILQPQTVDLMLRDHLGDLPRDAALGRNGYGLGVGVVTAGSAAVAGLPAGSVFWGGASNTFFWLDRERGLIGLYLGQTILQPDLGREFLRAVYADLGS